VSRLGLENNPQVLKKRHIEPEITSTYIPPTEEDEKEEDEKEEDEKEEDEKEEDEKEEDEKKKRSTLPNLVKKP
jgi:ribosomal protein L12E/L44/L45/RPP1/RPP2